VFDRFTTIDFTEEVFTSARHGRVVFAEAKGDFVRADNGAPYRNLYLFKVELRGSQIAAITEYNNPVIICQNLGC
jgi:ketosteroid isomerase-like protein